MDSDPLTRKRAAFLLREGLLTAPSSVTTIAAASDSATTVSLPDQWSVYLTLLEVLEDCPIHLVAEMWPQHQLLFAESPFHGSAADSFGDVPVVDQRVPFKWAAALVTKGLAHVQPRVRKAILKSVVDCSQRTCAGPRPTAVLLMTAGPHWLCFDALSTRIGG